MGTALVATVLLAGCSSTTPEGPEGLVRNVGFVLLTEMDDGADGSVSARGTFSRRNEPRDLVGVEDPFGADAATCHVGGAASAGSTSPGSPVTEAQGDPLEAGDVLSIHHDGVVLVSLSETTAGAYETAASASIALPDDGLSLDVPGGAFPAFDDAAFAATKPFSFAAGFDPYNVTGTSQVLWEGEATESSVALFVGVDGDAVFSCVAPDTGAFQFDATMQAALADAGYVHGAIAFAGRLSVQAHVEGESALLLGVLRARPQAPLVPASSAQAGAVGRAIEAALAAALR